MIVTAICELPDSEDLTSRGPMRGRPTMTSRAVPVTMGIGASVTVALEWQWSMAANVMASKDREVNLILILILINSVCKYHSSCYFNTSDNSWNACEHSVRARTTSG